MKLALNLNMKFKVTQLVILSPITASLVIRNSLTIKLKDSLRLSQNFLRN